MGFFEVWVIGAAIISGIGGWIAYGDEDERFGTFVLSVVIGFLWPALIAGLIVTAPVTIPYAIGYFVHKHRKVR